jgi:hypothetical protein
MAATDGKLAEKVDDAARAVREKTREKSRHAAHDVKEKLAAAKGAVRPHRTAPRGSGPARSGC